MKELLDKYGIKYVNTCRSINYFKIPKTIVPLEVYNLLVRKCNELHFLGKINKKFLHTKSGGISINANSLHYNMNCYEIIGFDSKWRRELLIVKGIMCRIVYEIASTEQDDNPYTGRKAIKRLTKEFKKDNIDLKDYHIDNGKKIKESIPKPLIKMVRGSVKDHIFTNAYHLDINSAYPYFMTKKYPEWYKTINRIYEQRKQHKAYKCILNYSYGYFQSKYYGYKLADVSKYCVEETINLLIQTKEVLEKNNCLALAYNTDGLWFTDKSGKIAELLEKEVCGDKLGQFKLDHKNCQIRFKSDGCYEYIENGKYKPVVRGKTTYDSYKSREDWQWGDIYRCGEPFKYYDSATEYGVIEEVQDNEKD